jgi:hypothetical protein
LIFGNFENNVLFKNYKKKQISFKFLGFKSGEYKLNLCAEFVEMPFHQQNVATKTEPIFIWDGNFAAGGEDKTKCDETEPIEGHCHLSMGAILPMVEKCARMMRQNGQIIKGGWKKKKSIKK